ncbi:MAG TPA: YhjD/YihY/BrkB family envelope integrity protein, partial [Streptosporangiaceae bacterium]
MALRALVRRVEGAWNGLRSRADAFQRRHATVGFPYAVLRKYSDDNGGRLAALLTYYGFLSLFPLLLLAVTILTEVLKAHPALRQDLIAELVPPYLHSDVEKAIHQLPPSGIPLLVGALGLLWSGTGGVLAGSAALNQIWAIPHRERPGLPHRYGRVLLMLLLTIAGAFAAAGLAALSSSYLHPDWVQRTGSAIGTFTVATVVLVLAHKLLTARPRRIREIWSGAVPAALVVTAALDLGAWILPALIARSGPVYGSFATVVGIFSLLYIVSQALVFSGEISSVHVFRLFPRGLDSAAPTFADVSALTLLAREQERLPGQRISATFAGSLSLGKAGPRAGRSLRYSVRGGSPDLGDVRSAGAREIAPTANVLAVGESMAAPNDNLARAILPIPDRAYPGVITYDAKDPDTKFPPITPVRPPAAAPNVLIVLIDDVGFGASSAFGGPVHTPTAERLAGEGLRYTRFHTTALCSPTRAALLSGRNHHAVGMGSITETATAAPGYSSMRPNTCTPLPETLRLNGYATAHLGKCHEVPVWETSPAGPFDRWPTGNGFEYFYGFIGGETNQWYPDLVEGTTPIEPPGTPEQGYHLMPDLTDRAIRWVRQERALTPDRPFFMYFAPGATHAPHHVPIEWADKYRGRFDQGWDRIREETFARQKDLGVIPADCELTKRHDEIPAWDDMDDELKPVLRRQMEIYAGFLEYADHHVGRLVDTLAQLEVLDDTLIYYIIGDNGASAEGSPQGTLNEIAIAEAPGLETPRFLRDNIDKLGGPEAYNHYAVGWAHAMCTPYQWTKQVASHWGGTRNGTIVHWPGGFAGRGEIRNQFSHVIDVAPTVLEVAGLPEPVQVHGVTQEPMHGASMRASFGDAGAPEHHLTQYFEMFCNRGIYDRGWTAVTRHSTPWVMGPLPSFDEDVWELYDTSTDWSQSHDLAAE